MIAYITIATTFLCFLIGYVVESKMKESEWEEYHPVHLAVYVVLVAAFWPFALIIAVGMATADKIIDARDD